MKMYRSADSHVVVGRPMGESALSCQVSMLRNVVLVLGQWNVLVVRELQQ